MVKKLRRNFILITMISTALVLLLIIGSINIANYMNMIQTVNMRLSVLSENEGRFPSNMPKDKAIRKNPGPGAPKLPSEAPFDTRYFTVSLSSDGNILTVNTDKIAAVSEEDAKAYVHELYTQNKSGGFYGNYKYTSLSTTGPSGTETILYIFLDCQRELSSFHNFLVFSIVFSLLGLLLVLILILIFSNILLRPVTESYQKQKRFITDASHELKTPMAIIDANTEVIEMEYGESEWTISIRKQIGRLTSLTEKLVFLSRMDEGSQVMTATTFSLSDAVCETAEPYAMMAEMKNRTFTMQVQPDISYCGEEASIRQLISLLLDNAMKYSPENTEISLECKLTGKGRIIQISNQTDDMSAGKHEELFERFYRADTSRNSSTGGHGIGLSVARAIVQMHKGKITAKCDTNHRLSFVITL